MRKQCDRSAPGLPDRSQRHVDVLDLSACEQLVDRLLASHARLFVSAERYADVVRAGAVDPDVAGLDATGETMCAVEIVSPDGARESVLERVHATQQVSLVAPTQHADHRSEDLLARDAHLVVNVGEHRRLDEIAGCEAWIRGSFAANDQARAVVTSMADVCERLVELRLAREAADLCVPIGGQPELQSANALYDRLEGCVVNVL